MENEKIAVLLSSYNGEKYIKQQIESILNQKIDCELLLIIRDDGSKDHTVEILNKLKKNDERIILYSENNVGTVASFFKLIDIARHLPNEFKFFSLADQDDVWDLDKLQIAINVIRQKKNIPFLYGSATRPVSSDLQPLQIMKKKYRDINLYNSIIQNFIPGNTYVMNRELLEHIHDVDTKKIYVHDSYILNVAIITGELYYDEIPHVSYRQHSDNQFGTSSRTPVAWYKNRINRLMRGEGKKYAHQIMYVVRRYDAEINNEQKKEIKSFLKARKNLFTRALYIRKTKLYRQKPSEQKAFKLMYLLGGYND